MNNKMSLISVAEAAHRSGLLLKNGNKTKEYFEAGYLENVSIAEMKTVPQKLKQFEIVWVKTGTGSFALDFLYHEIKDNLLYFVFPGQIYQFNPAPGISGYRICFSEAFLNHRDESFYLPFAINYQCRDYNQQIMQVDKEMEIEMHGVVRTMIRECCNNFPLKSEILKGLLKIFMAYFSRRFTIDQLVDVKNNDIRLFKDFLDILDRNYHTKKAVADYAEELSVSANYLSEVIKKVSGSAASHHIQQRLILEAKRATVYSEVSMKEISYQLGFMDPSQFSKFFKTKTGMNFSEYKKGLTSSARPETR